MRDRSMQSGTELVRQFELTDWSMAGNLFYWSSGVQIPRDICTRLKVARNSFHFPQTSFTNSFSKYSLVYRISLKFTTVINETSQNHFIIFFSENLLPWQPYNAFSCTPKSKAIVLLREQVGEIFSNSYITCYQERSLKYASLNKFCRADETKNLLFDYCVPNFFPTYRIFLKIGIYTHPIDLSCHQKFEKNSPTRSGNLSARSWKI